MRNKPNYEIVNETDAVLLIKDIGPWSEHMTVTNGAETVAEELAPRLQGRRLHYIDSGGRTDEICVTDGKFTGFASID